MLQKAHAPSQELPGISGKDPRPPTPVLWVGEERDRVKKEGGGGRFKSESRYSVISIEAKGQQDGYGLGW